jgi:hypothetical protein
MGLLPDKILEDEEIGAFIDRTNSTSGEIVSDSKFKIPNQNLFGLGLLVKLQIKILEKSLSSLFAPIFIGKKALGGEGLDEIRTAFNSIKTIFSSPLQFLLDEGFNSTLKEFPFPLELRIGESSGDVDRLKSLIDNSGPDPIDSTLERYNYETIFLSSSSPEKGQITTNSSSLATIRTIRVSTVTENSDPNFSLSLLKIGDNLDITDGPNYGSFRVTSIRKIKGTPDYYEFGLTLLSLSFEESNSSGSVTIPNFSNVEIRTSRRLILRNFIKDGSLIIPFSVLGLNFPLLSRINLVIGDFSKVSPDSPTAKYLQELGAQSGLDFSEILSGILEGKFPKIDFKETQENPDSQQGKREQRKEDLVSFARLIQIGAENPFFLIKIILNILKLLLLPVHVFLSSLAGLAKKITNPIGLIRIVILGITNPIKLFCDLISEAILEFIEPYIAQFITPIMPYSEAKQDPIDPGRGLRPLISDMVCGKFSRDLKKFTPSKDFLDSIRTELNQAGQGDQIDKIPLSFPYDFIGSLEIPEAGQLTADSSNIDSITRIRVSYKTGNVSNALAPLVNVTVGEIITLFVGERFQKFRITYKRIDQDFIEYGVLKQITETGEDQISNEERAVRGINIARFSSQLTVNNQNKTPLFILEKYLPLKLIIIWESIKGILAIFGALAIQIPSIFPAIIRSLFGLNKLDLNQRVDKIKKGEDIGESPDVSVDSLDEILDLASRSWAYESTVKDFATPEFNEGIREAFNSILNDDESPIETLFYDLDSQLQELGLDRSVFKEKLSSENLGGADLGKNFLYNREEGDNSYKFSTSMPNKNSFYYGSYSVNELGISTKILLSVLYKYRNLDYFSSDELDTNEIDFVVRGKNREGISSDLYSGRLRQALSKYRVTTQGFPEKVQARDLRILINRELWFIRTYLLPSLKK